MDRDAAPRQRERDPTGPDGKLERPALARQLREGVDDGVDRLRREHLVVIVVVRRRDELVEVAVGAG